MIKAVCMKKKEILILLIALCLVCLVYFLSTLAGGAPLGTVSIYVDGRLYAQEPLGRSRDITLEQPTGEKNVIHLMENGFYMAYSTCDNQSCIHQGQVTADNYYLRALGAQVICLPNRVHAELSLTDQTPPPDMPDL